MNAEIIEWANWPGRTRRQTTILLLSNGLVGIGDGVFQADMDTVFVLGEGLFSRRGKPGGNGRYENNLAERAGHL